MAERVPTKHAGLLLCVPDLVALDLPAIVNAAGYPGTSVIPAVSSILSLLALKLANVRRTSHVEDLATDHGAALFAGLSSLPKTTALTSYSYKLSHERQHAFLHALNEAMLRAGLIDGTDFDLDFHAIMHWGEDAALEKHYVPSRSQRTRSVLRSARTPVTHPNGNGDICKSPDARPVITICDPFATHVPARATRDRSSPCRRSEPRAVRQFAAWLSGPGRSHRRAHQPVAESLAATTRATSRDLATAR